MTKSQIKISKKIAILEVLLAIEKNFHSRKFLHAITKLSEMEFIEGNSHPDFHRKY